MKKVGLGIIGLGYIGQVHLRHSLKLRNAHLIGVSDVSKKALEKAKKMGVEKTFNNYEDLLREKDIDAVIIALPTHLHPQCAKHVAEAQKHIFLEKPIARNVDEAKEIIAAAERNSVKLMIGYPLRFNQSFGDLRKKIRRGIVGDVVHAQATYIGCGPFFHRAEGYSPVPVPDWWFNKELTGGGVLMDLGSHMINLLRWYCGEIASIKSFLGYRLHMDFEDSANLIVEFKSGTTGLINIGWYSQDYTLKMDVFGSVKHCSVRHHPPHFFFTATQMFALGTSVYFWPHFAEVQYFVDCLIEDTPLSSSGWDGLQDLRAIDQAYKNATRLN